jgi:hypothetical protein
VLASSHFPPSLPPGCFPQFPQFVFPLLAVAEEMLPGLGCLPARPKIIIVLLVEALEIVCGERMLALELVVSRGE